MTQTFTTVVIGLHFLTEKFLKNELISNIFQPESLQKNCDTMQHQLKVEMT